MKIDLSHDNTTHLFRTYSNHRVNLLDPGVKEICIEDIAIPLSRQCRFRGHCKHFYSNAQHSLFLATLAEQFYIWSPGDVMLCLLHDATEAYLGDSISFTKSKEYYRIGGNAYMSKRVREGRMFEDVLKALTPPPFYKPLLSGDKHPLHRIKSLHDTTTKIELEHLMHFTHDELWKVEDDFVKDIRSVISNQHLHPLANWPMEDVANDFKTTYARLFNLL